MLVDEARPVATTNARRTTDAMRKQRTMLQGKPLAERSEQHGKKRSIHRLPGHRQEADSRILFEGGARRAGYAASRRLSSSRLSSCRRL
jgi:hypothetical protein